MTTNTPATGDAVQQWRDMSEAQMREAVAPTPKSMDELSAVIGALTERDHDYGTCVYAMSIAAVAAFNMVASKLGVSGFQASCADMDVIRRMRRYKGPFMLIDGANALFPQYDLPEEVREFLSEIEPWLGEQAREELAKGSEHTHPNVLAHWQRLAQLPTPPSAQGGAK